ncbi:adenylate/guanylate cyclase domain-containing protein [bacterium]|nr:adenylate/guanylate cyclase domain-containing protein [bacterium]
MFDFMKKFDRKTSLEIFYSTAIMIRKIDDRLEKAQKYYHPIEEPIPEILDYLLECVRGDQAILIYRDDNLDFKLYQRVGGGKIISKAEEIEILKQYSENKNCKTFWSNNYYIHPLDVDGVAIGAAGIIIPEDVTEFENSRDRFLLSNFCEQLDNYILSENNSRKKHIVKMQIGEALENRIFSDGLVEAIKILKENIDFSTLILLYHDEYDLELKTLKYFIYSEEKGFFDPFHFFDKKTHNYIIENGIKILNDEDSELFKQFKIDTYKEEYLISGVKKIKKLGMLIISSDTSIFDQFEKELLEVFVSFIQQRVIDFNKEWRNLSQFFSVTQRLKLLESDDYSEKYLSPKLEEVAIVYADISSFTFFSEQVLKTPKLITNMFDIWASGVLKIIWENGGCCDKFVGDCVIVFFGPPFFDGIKHDNCMKALKCAEEIREFTNSLVNRPENCFKLIKESGNSDLFGVSTGINYGLLNIGVIGPNNDYTGFGSVMNNTARIQGIAHKNEILMMKPFKNIIDDVVDVDGPYFSSLKNVKEKAEYYRYNRFK